MGVEFKEKTYEMYFSTELARLTRITYAPDQCDEAFLGFDGAFRMPPMWLRANMLYMRRSRLARLQGIPISTLDTIAANMSRRLPTFRLNLFVQFKRPVYLKSRGAAEWPHWKSPYYRYPITPHQQKLLNELDQQSHGRAIVVYASPAIWKAQDLFVHAEAGAVVANSNIASVGRLSGHKQYTYSMPGFSGKGHSEATDISSPALEVTIRQRLSEGEEQRLDKHLLATAELIATIVASDDEAKQLFSIARSALGEEEYKPGSLIESVKTINAFSDAFGVSYYAMG